MTLATREQILASKDYETRDIDSAWGVLRIRTMSAAERLRIVERYQSDTLTNEQAAAFYVELISTCLIDADGAPLFSNGDAEALHNRCWDEIERVATEVMKFNGLAADDVKEPAKN